MMKGAWSFVNMRGDQPSLARKKFLPICRGKAKHIGDGMNTKFAAIIVAMSLATSLGFLGAAQAKGCIKGAIAGGVAGHYAGHHGWTGAAAGCIAGRHMANQKARHEKELKQKQLQQQPAQAGPQREPSDMQKDKPGAY